MTEGADSPGSASTQSAGALLRAAREQRGMHIAALAAAIKVPQRKLEALEADRYDELPDMTFTRALAQSVCRTLKVDMQPVLDRLPQTATASPKLEHVGVGLNAPFRERPGRSEPTDWSWLRKPVVWGTLLVVAAAAFLYFLPDAWLGRLAGRQSGAPATTSPVAAEVVATPASAPLPAGSAVDVSPAAAVPAMPAAEAASAPVALAPTGAVAGSALSVRATGAESWIEVLNARGEVLLSRSLVAGETVGVDGAPPLRVTVGNASATQLTFRGKAVDLSASTRDNVARLQLN